MPDTFPAHSASCIRYRNFHILPGCDLTYRHFSSMFCKFNSIGKKIVPHQLHQTGICLYHCFFFHIDFQLQFFLIPQLLILKDTFLQLPAEIIPFDLRIDPLILQLIQLQDITDQSGQMPGSLFNISGAVFFFLFTDIFHLEKFRIVFNNSNRRLHFMGNIRDKICFQCFYTSQFLHHLVKVQDHHIQIIQFVSSMDGRNINREIPSCYLFCSFCQPVERFFVGIFHFLPCKKSQPYCYHAPVNYGKHGLNDLVPFQCIHQNYQALM